MIRTKNVWVLFYRAPDVPGQWIAHCLDLDVMSQADSFEHARASLLETVQVCMADDMQHDLDPFDREPAPDDCWEPLFHLMKHSIPLSSVPPEEREARLRLVAAQARLSINTVDAYPELQPEPWDLASVPSSANGHSIHC